jgi:predicted transcriptional regulator
MEELKKTSQIVLKLLREDILTRKDDNYLIKRVHESIIPGASDMTLNQVLGLITRKELPCFESIRRARQKVQEKYPELTDVTTMIHRADKEQEYIEFVRCYR